MRRLIFLVPLVVLLACTESSTPTEPDPRQGTELPDGRASGAIALSSTRVALTPFQSTLLARVDGEGFPAGASFQGTLGDVPVTLGLANGQLALLVPPLPPGPAELRVDLAGVTASVLLEILAAPPIANPSELVHDYFEAEGASLAAQRELAGELVSSGAIRAAELEAIDALRRRLAEHRARFDQLDEGQRSLVALAIRTSTDEVQDAITAGDEVFETVGTRSDADLAAAKRLLLKFSKHLVLYTSPAVVGGMYAGLPGAVAGVALAKLVLRDRWESQKTKAIATWNELAALQLRPIDLLVEELRADIVFENRYGEKKPITIDVGWRNLSADDRNANVSWLTAVLAAVDAANAAFDRLFPGTLHMTFRLPTRGVEDPKRLSQLDIVELTDPAASCRLGGTPAAPTLSCEHAGPGVRSFTLRLELRVDEFVVRSEPLSIEVDTRCDTTVTASDVERLCRDAVTGRPAHLERCSGRDRATPKEWSRTEYAADGTLERVHVSGGTDGANHYLVKAVTSADGSTYTRGHCYLDATGGVTAAPREGVSLRTETRAAQSCVVREWGGGVRYDGTPFRYDSGSVTVARDAVACDHVTYETETGTGPSCADARNISAQTISSLTIMQDGLCGHPSTWPMPN